MVKVLATLLALVVPSAAVGKVHPVSLGQVEHMLDTMEPLAVVRVLSAGESETAADSRFDFVLDQIGKGKSAWIALAPRLARGTDAATSEGLGISLAQALPINPRAVLRVSRLDSPDSTESLDNVVGINRVCSVPFIETTRAFNDAYLRRTIPAVSRVRDADLVAKRDKCLARLKSL